MALTESTMMKIGTPAPDFELLDTHDEKTTRAQFEGQPLLVMFICNHCPYVKHVAEELAQIGWEFQPLGLGIVAIQSNDVAEYPDDSPEKMKQESVDRGYVFPYLFDESQSVANSYTAACTPDFFLFDSAHRLVYRGRLDETRPARIRSGVYDSTENQPHGKDLRAAIAAVLAGQTPTETQLPSLGCNIKWKPGNEPKYL
ncbi:MAG: peroxiredoxin [Mariniblastus sp.]|jgi:peroxiredoxin